MFMSAFWFLSVKLFILGAGAPNILILSKIPWIWLDVVGLEGGEGRLSWLPDRQALAIKTNQGWRQIQVNSMG